MLNTTHDQSLHFGPGVRLSLEKADSRGKHCKNHTKSTTVSVAQDMARAQKQKARKLGKANPLPGKLWVAWLNHVLASGPSWLYVALFLTHACCLRISEVLRLKMCHIDTKHGHVWVGPLKRGNAMYKKIMPPLLKKVKDLKAKGVKRKRSKNAGARGVTRVDDIWAWPKKPRQFLFPSKRVDAVESCMVKNTVCKAVTRLRKTFRPPAGSCLEVDSIRSHSGRHRFINDCKSSGLADSVVMSFARISDQRTGTNVVFRLM